MNKRDFFREIKLRLRHNWRLFVCISAPLILCPIAFLRVPLGDHENGIVEIDPNKKFRTAYVITLMATFWVLETIPLAVTSLFPVLLFPLLDIQNAATVSKNYMKESNMIFLGAIILALSIEYCGLHIRGALRVIKICGTNPALIMLGTMIVTAFMSMWLSDTSCTTMILPILTALTSAMFREEQDEVMSREQDGLNRMLLNDKGKRSMGSIMNRVRRESHVFANSALQGHLNSSVRRRSKRTADNNKVITPSPPGSKSTVNESLSASDLEEMSGLEETDGAKSRRQSVESRTLSSMSVIMEGVAVPSTATAKGNGDKPENNADNVDQTNIDDTTFQTNIRKMLLFAVAYSASIGGTGSLIGTGPIKVFKELVKEYKLETDSTLTGITFTTWMAFNVPPLLVNITIAWLFLVFKYMGTKNLCKGYASADKVREYLRDEYRKLGPISAHEIGVLVIFISVVILWLLRDPQLFPGWGNLINTKTTGDSTPAMLGVILLFVLPKSWNFLKCGKGKYVPEQKYEALLDWKFVSTNAPWGYVLLIGSGYAIADASQKSQLSQYIGEGLRGLSHLTHASLLVIVIFLTSLITEVVSNTACASLILPILFSLSCRLRIHPIYLTMASAVTASYAFMLPISSPPNAIIFATGELRMREMLVNGLFLNFVCSLVLYFFIITYGELIFQFSDFDNHANQIYHNCSSFSSPNVMQNIKQ